MKHRWNDAVRRGMVAAAWPLCAVLCWSGTAAAADSAKGTPQHIRAVTSKVDGASIRANTKATKDWPSYGLDYAETRFSRLAQISDANVKDLGLAWTYNLESTRGIEATPLVVDGIMYVTASWSIVHAIDVRTGKRLWTYDPKVARTMGYKACCDVVNRGVALYKGRVYLGAYDGRLIALDAATGTKLWEQDTIADPKRSYTITGAPRIVKGNVIIGQAGAEYDVRGHVSAYDAMSGKLKWRWFTVPGDPSKPYENAAMKTAAATWDPSAKYWEAGGGGTVWDSVAYDPELNLLYIGTDNGTPWSRNLRSPKGGDNLFLASIVALDADTGRYVWHYQEVPGENWDYSSTQSIILADLTLDGKKRKVLLHAPKNGFFFVIDRTNGKYISANNYVDVNWATGYDAKGRPIEVPEARSDKLRDAIPGPFGAHNWHPMSFNPTTGLVYVPTQNVPINMADDKNWGFNSNKPGQPHGGLGWNLAMNLGEPTPANKPFGRLIAWDPVAKKEAWRVEQVSPWNGGTLATAGNLVFQGTADGRFVAYNAKSGEKVWEAAVGTGAVAAPSTYEVDGTQYVSIAVGWGGVYGLSQRATEREGPGTVYTYKIGGKAPLPEFATYRMGTLVAGVKYDPAHVQEGGGLYVSNCIFCHGVPGVDRGGNIKNLGYIPSEELGNLKSFVFNGPFVSQGMPDFTGKLTDEQVTKIQAFIQGTADAVRPKPAAAPASAAK